MKRLVALYALTLLCLVGCREVRVQTFEQGTTTVSGRDRIIVVRDAHELLSYGIHAPVKFNHEFGVLLLMGPHREGGWRQVIESIRANTDRVRIVAYERAPADGGEPSTEYRTYTLWIVPNLVYRSGSTLEAVTPSGDVLATTELR